MSEREKVFRIQVQDKWVSARLCSFLPCSRPRQDKKGGWPVMRRLVVLSVIFLFIVCVPGLAVHSPLLSTNSVLHQRVLSKQQPYGMSTQSQGGAFPRAIELDGGAFLMHIANFGVLPTAVSNFLAFNSLGQLWSNKGIPQAARDYFFDNLWKTVVHLCFGSIGTRSIHRLDSHRPGCGHHC